MIRKLLTALILVPLAIVLASLAVANRQPVIISFDPYDGTNSALVVALPLFALMLALLIAGVILGGAAAWVRQGKWRARARRLDAEARRLRLENEQLRMPTSSVAPPPSSRPVLGRPRLTIPPAA
jgi:uncharacterized integral membrane protein